MGTPPTEIGAGQGIGHQGVDEQRRQCANCGDEQSDTKSIDDLRRVLQNKGVCAGTELGRPQPKALFGQDRFIGERCRNYHPERYQKQESNQSQPEIQRNLPPVAGKPARWRVGLGRDTVGSHVSFVSLGNIE